MDLRTGVGHMGGAVGSASEPCHDRAARHTQQTNGPMSDSWPRNASANVGMRRQLCERLTRDLISGRVIFRGRIEDIDGTRLRSTAQRLLGERLDEIYPQLHQFTANLKSKDVIQLLRTTDLATLPEDLREEGISLVEATPDGYVLVTDRGPLDALVNEIGRRASYGYEATGAYLENHFAKPPFGAQVEVVQALCAAALRTGMVETIHQGQLIVNAGDQRLDQVFGTLPKFRAAAFRPPSHTDVPIELRVDLAKRLEHYGQFSSGHSTELLADAVRETFDPARGNNGSGHRFPDRPWHRHTPVSHSHPSDHRAAHQWRRRRGGHYGPQCLGGSN